MKYAIIWNEPYWELYKLIPKQGMPFPEKKPIINGDQRRETKTNQYDSALEVAVRILQEGFGGVSVSTIINKKTKTDVSKEVYQLQELFYLIENIK